MKNKLVIATAGLFFASLAQGQDFLPHSTFATGKATPSITSGNFNGGSKDLVTANPNNNDISFMAGNGTGFFSSVTTTTSTGVAPNDIVRADFDNDGDMDIATANIGSSTSGSWGITLELNNGSGIFSQYNFTSTSVTPKPKAITALDFDQDGDLDIATSNQSGGTSTSGVTGSVSIFRNNLPAGTFGSQFFTTTQLTIPYTAFEYLSAPAFPIISVGKDPNYIASGDLNNDGKEDLIVSNVGDGNISILQSLGNGDFTAFSSSPLAEIGVREIFVGNLIGDVNLDLAVVKATATTAMGSVSIYKGDGTGIFSTADQNIAVEKYSLCITGIDVNLDGYKDLAVGNQTSKNVSILMNQAKVNFDNSTPALSVGSGTSGPFSITSEDFNNDGRPDLATADGFNISVLINDTTPTNIKNEFLSDQNAIFPNPTSNGRFTLKLSKIPSGTSWIQIHDIKGRLIQKVSQKIELVNTIQLSPTLAKGTYIVTLMNNKEGQLASRKLMYQ